MAKGVFKMKQIKPHDIRSRERIFLMLVMYYVFIRKIQDLMLSSGVITEHTFKNIGHASIQMKNRPSLPCILCNVHSKLIKPGQLL